MYYLKGSICPKETKSYTIQIKESPEATLSIPYFNLKFEDASTGLCRFSSSDKTYTVNAYGHLCFPFSAQFFTSDCEAYFELYWDGSYLYWDAISCDYDDCLPYYYGNNCQYSVEEYDDQTQCDVSLGKSGTGKCISCMNVSSIQPQCRAGLSKSGVKLYSKSFWEENWEIQYSSNNIYLED